MVIRRTIGDWYADAEMRDAADPGRDWENDEIADRTPDSWLDKLGASSPPHFPTDSHGRTRLAGSADQAHPPGTSCQCGPCQTQLRKITATPSVDLATAARKLHSTMPNAKDSTLARHLRRSGWPDVTTDQVRRALVGLNDRQLQGTTPPTEKSFPKPRVKKSSPKRQSLAEAAKAAQRIHPRRSIRKLAQKLRQSGWPNVTEDEVHAALAPSPRSELAPAPPLRTPQTHPDACPACGMVVTWLGRCRCS